MAAFPGTARFLMKRGDIRRYFPPPSALVTATLPHGDIAANQDTGIDRIDVPIAASILLLVWRPCHVVGKEMQVGVESSGFYPVGKYFAHFGPNFLRLHKMPGRSLQFEP